MGREGRGQKDEGRGEEEGGRDEGEGRKGRGGGKSEGSVFGTVTKSISLGNCKIIVAIA